MRDKSHGRPCDPKPFVPRSHFRFSMGPNSSVRKFQRWINRGGGVAPLKLLNELTSRHIHPRRRRYFLHDLGAGS